MEESLHHSKEGRTKNLLKNYWAISTIVLAVLLFGMVINLYNNSGIGKIEAGQKVVDFAKLQGFEAKTVSVTEEGNLYKVTIEINGQQQPIYVTKDGKNVAFQVVDLDKVKEAKPADTAKPQPADVPKSDKPLVELFVMSYCPFGTQNEKGIIPVVETLKDKIDFQLKFVYYAMHGKKETDENTLQYCLQKEQKDKFLPYLKCFLKESKSAECLVTTGVDKAKLDACAAAADTQFKITENLNNQASWLSGQFPKYDVNLADNNKYGIGGSPALVINGKEVQARAPAQILSLVCSAFNTQPEECKTTLDTATPSPGFGFSTTSAGTDASCGN